MTGNEMFTKLIHLRNQAGEFHYQRAKLAQQLLQDRAWVESEEGGGGSEDRALDRLEEDCFPDLCGLISMVQLLELASVYPSLDQWKSYKFDLKRMWAEANARKQPQKKKITVPRGPMELPSVADFEESTPVQRSKQYARALHTVETERQKIARLEAENKELKEENARLKEQVRSMKELARKIA